MTTPNTPQSTKKKIEDICYRMYENSGNSKYIRAEWSGKPFHPDEATQQLLTILKGTCEAVIGEDEANSFGPEHPLHYATEKMLGIENDLRTEQRKTLNKLIGEDNG